MKIIIVFTFICREKKKEKKKKKSKIIALEWDCQYSLEKFLGRSVLTVS